jgi:adenylate cyclase
MNQERTKRKLCGILSADVVGYSRLMEEDEAWTIKSLDENKRLIGKLVTEYEGRVVDSPGDNLLIEFNSVINAVECAGKIQQKLKIKNDRLTENRRMEFRIGVNLGEVIEEDGRIYGSGVNIAARLEGLAKPGGICISSTTYDQVSTKLNIGYEYLGEHNVKNITEPIKVYRVLLDTETAGKVIGRKKPRGHIPHRAATGTIIVLLIIAAGLAGWIIYYHQYGKIDTAAIVPQQTSVKADTEESISTIAVLPFDDLSPEKDHEYFVDGLSEEILNSLTQIPDLTVISRTSSFAFKDSNKTIPEIAEILNVSNVLEGTVRKSENELLITAQLIRAKDSAQLWSKKYNREFKDIFAIQEDIATSVANELKLTLGIGDPRRPVGGPENLKAYEMFLSARGQIFAQGQFPGVRPGRPLESITSVIKMNPEFPDAWVMKSGYHLSQVPIAPPDRVPFELEESLKTAKNAVNLKPNFGLARIMLGQAYSARGDFIEAEKAYNEAIKLTDKSNSSLEIIMHYTRMGYLKKSDELLRAMGRFDPIRSLTDAANILNLGYMGDLTQAEREYQRGKAIFGSKNQWIYGDLNITILRLGSGKVLSISDIPELPERFDPVWSIGRKNIMSPKEGLAELHDLFINDNKLNSMHLIIMSCFAAYFGDPGFALDAMEKSVRMQTSGLYFTWSPLMKNVRQLPQFKKFAREIGLVDYWQEFGWPDLCRLSGDDDFECD